MAIPINEARKFLEKSKHATDSIILPASTTTTATTTLTRLMIESVANPFVAVDMVLAFKPTTTSEPTMSKSQPACICPSNFFFNLIIILLSLANACSLGYYFCRRKRNSRPNINIFDQEMLTPTERTFVGSYMRQMAEEEGQKRAPPMPKTKPSPLRVVKEEVQPTKPSTSKSMSSSTSTSGLAANNLLLNSPTPQPQPPQSYWDYVGSFFKVIFLFFFPFFL